MERERVMYPGVNDSRCIPSHAMISAMGKQTMTDPTFGKITFSIDAWDGLVPFEHEPSGISTFAVHVWADESGPTSSQRATFEELKARCATLWPVIIDAMVGCHPTLGSAYGCRDGVDSTVGRYMQRVASQGHEDFELVYELTSEPGRAIFVTIAGWQVVESVVAD
jgi:hypothetical protein